MKKLKIFMAVMLILVSCLLVFSSCSNKKDITVSDITSVEVKGKGDKREVKIEAEFTEADLEKYKGQKVYLIAKDMSGSDVTYSALDEAKIKSSIKFEVPFKNQGKTYINTAFVCAVAEGEGDAMQFTPITNERYITNAADMGENVDRPSTSSIKGLATSNIGHADYLGAQHIILEVRLDSILLERYEDGAQSITSQGLTYYFDGNYVENLDRKIKQATEAGNRVYLQFILKDPESDESVSQKDRKDRIDCLYLAGALSQSPEAFLPDMSSKQTVGYLTALFDFMAERYSGGEHGVAIDYIIGKNANSTAWSNAGKTDAKTALSYYVNYVRLAYNSLTSRVSNGRVYASFNNTWLGAKGNGSYGYILSFASQASTTGDFGWNIALSYGDIDSDNIWGGEKEYGETFNTGSLGELSGLLDGIKYKKSNRSVVISTFSLRQNPENENSASNRGASYTYTYYKTANSGVVDALIYSVYDSELRGLVNGTSSTETSLCEPFMMCGSNSSGNLEKYSTVLGDKWYEIKASDAMKKISVYYAQPASDVNTANPKNFFDFTSGSIYGFEPAGSAEFAGLAEFVNAEGETGTHLVSGGDVSNTEHEWRVVYCESIDKTEIDSSKYLGVTMASQYADETVTVIITGTAKKTGDKISLIATARVGSTPQEYCFDMANFADRLKDDDVSVSICSPQMKGLQRGDIFVYKASLYGASGSRILAWIIIAVILVLVAVGIVVAVAILDKRRKKNGTRQAKGKAVKNSSQKRKSTPVTQKAPPVDDSIIDNDGDTDDEIVDDDDEDELPFDLNDEDDA